MLVEQVSGLEVDAPPGRGAVTRPARGRAVLVGGHPLLARGVAAALGAAFDVDTGGRPHGATDVSGSVVVVDLTCSACAPSPDVVADAAGRQPVVVLVDAAQVGRAEDALGSGALAAVGSWEPEESLAAAVLAASTGQTWASSSFDAAARRVRELRRLLSGQELEALRLYGSDLPVKSVARRMGITDGTAKEYLKRLRLKLSARGIPVSTKLDLRAVAEDLGLLTGRAVCGAAGVVEVVGTEAESA